MKAILQVFIQSFEFGLLFWKKAFSFSPSFHFLFDYDLNYEENGRDFYKCTFKIWLSQIKKKFECEFWKKYVRLVQVSKEKQKWIIFVCGEPLVFAFLSSNGKSLAFYLIWECDATSLKARWVDGIGGDNCNSMRQSRIDSDRLSMCNGAKNVM